jgi:hypothetical protein
MGASRFVCMLLSCRWGAAPTLLAFLILLSGCASLDPDRWRFKAKIVRVGEWQVLYGNHWPKRYDMVVVQNCARPGKETATQTQLVLAREDPVRPPEEAAELLPVDRLYEPIADISPPGARRNLIVDSGWRLAARTTDGDGRICIRLVSSLPLEL